MPGNGKYTTYAPPDGAKNTLLKKLFGKAPASALPPQMANDPGKEEDVRKEIVALAKQHLQPASQKGDLNYFSQGVKLDFSGAPDLTSVKWTNPGDPANSYSPDISSPGPGKTSGKDKDADPGLFASDIKPTYVPGGVDTGTRSPSATSAKIVAANVLDDKSDNLPDGSSGADV